MSTNTNNLASFIWSLADLLRGDFKQSQYGRVILPFTLLRRLECVLTDSKQAVLDEKEKIASMNLPRKLTTASLCSSSTLLKLSKHTQRRLLFKITSLRNKGNFLS